MESFGRDVSKKVIKEVPVATGKSAQSIKYTVFEGGIEVYQEGGWFGALVGGRGPRKSDENTNFEQRLSEWASAVGFKGSVRSLRYWINKSGTDRFITQNKSSLADLNFDSDIKTLSARLATHGKGVIVTAINQHINK